MITPGVGGDDRCATPELMLFCDSQPTGIPTGGAILVARLKAEFDTTSLTSRRYLASRRWTIAS
ncbi:hypothetical protein [Janibacter sp. HTCC2649]|uniref:hypothetical protein n=1 Tax=Janibacter sp. HTCC2649 TaxID=313589 RepID=UPI0002DC1778|nr:hypothetical protein [Janibacter sp. HTCC2649]